MEKITFRVEYDDMVWDIVKTISCHLKPYGITIEGINEEYDGYEMYEIIIQNENIRRIRE